MSAGIGMLPRAALTAIANAIRAQSGAPDTYNPDEMGAAVASLDGSGSDGAQLEAETGSGLVARSALTAIADAIRAQNGLTETYTPLEMPAAILALTWDTGLKIRALLHEDGTLEFNYRAGRSSDLASPVVSAWEVDPAGYDAEDARPWHDSRAQVLRAQISADVAGSALSSCAHWFRGCSALAEVSGFEALAGVSDMEFMFGSCAELETIWAGSWEPAGEIDGFQMFSGCGRLVGGQGYVPEPRDDEGALSLGADGVLTDPEADGRSWYRCFLYSDGELVLTAASEPETGRAAVASGRLCAEGRYTTTAFQPWYGHRSDVASVEFASDMAGYSCVNLDYLFYAHLGLEEVSGLGHLNGCREARHTFNGCDALTELDFSGFDTSALEDLTYTFASCSALTTIWGDADWTLPEAVSGGYVFYGCDALVGGAGTAFSDDAVGAECLRIDAPPEAPGYMTAK